MGLFSRLFGRRDWLEQAEVNAVKREKREKKAVQQAIANPDVEGFLDERSLGSDDLRALRSRLSASVPEEHRADQALQNIELLDWFFSLPDPSKLNLDESLQLINWVRYGTKP